MVVRLRCCSKYQVKMLSACTRIKCPSYDKYSFHVLDIRVVEGFLMQNYLQNLLPIPNNSLGSANNLCKLGNGLGAYIQALLNEAQNKYGNCIHTRIKPSN